MLKLTGTEDIIYSLSSIQGLRNWVPKSSQILGKKKSQGLCTNTHEMTGLIYHDLKGTDATAFFYSQWDPEMTISEDISFP